MKTDELLRAGIEAARAGDLERAASYFAHAVQADPSSEQGWYMLGMSVAQPERKVYCLRRALALNPQNDEARKQLDRLLAPLPPTPPPAQTAPPAQAPPPAETPSAAAPGEAPEPASEEVVKTGGWSPPEWPPRVPKYEPTDETPPDSSAPAAAPMQPIEAPAWMEAEEPAEDQTPFVGGEALDRLSSLSPAEQAATIQPAAEPPTIANEEPPRPAWMEPAAPAGQPLQTTAKSMPQAQQPEAADEVPSAFAVDDSPLKAFLSELDAASGEAPAAPAAPAPKPPIPQGAPKPAAQPARTKAEARDGSNPPASGALPQPAGQAQPAAKAAPRAAVARGPAPSKTSQTTTWPPSAEGVQKTLEKARKRNKSSPIVLVALSVLLLMLCALVVFYLVYSGTLSRLLSPAPVQVPTALVMPTSAATEPVTSQGVAEAATEVPPTASPTALPTPKPTVSYTPTYEASACQFDAPKGAHVTCGFVIVPEDRTGDPTHTIRLAVAVYHASGSSPDPVPVLFLQGGPGGEAVKLSADAYPLLVAPFVKQRDFIAYDQRGTGLSEPALDCPDLTKAYLQDIYGQIPASARKIVYSNAFLSCQGQTSVGGVNLNAYTTEESAADVKDLLQVLKYQQVDLYGASYGTRLAQVIMRDDPGIVHAAILDSVVPIETNFFAEYPSSIEGALKLVFDSCKADPTCNAAYPDLETVFWDQVNRLDAKPVPLTIANPQTGTVTENVDGSVFVNVVLMSLKMSSLIETAPQTIYRFKAGDYSTVIAAEYSLPYAFQGINIGLYISMMCHEQILRTTPDQLQAAMASSVDIQTYAWLPFFGNAQDVYHYCQSWRAAGPYLGENDPVKGDVPTLIITGKFDPTTPPKYAELVAAQLSHSYYFEFPNQGHTPTAADTSGCAMDTAVAFLADPQVEPDRSCLNAIHALSFVLPYTGDPAVELKTVDVGGISAKMPRDWPSLGDGFYMRANSPFDITQIGMTEVPGTSSVDVLKWLSQKAWGYRGLDSAPVWSSQRTSNGLDWALYTATSYGRPVDIAMADHNGTSIVVLAFDSIDEHEALYQTVFLPVVDSIRP